MNKDQRDANKQLSIAPAGIEIAYRVRSLVATSPSQSHLLVLKLNLFAPVLQRLGASQSHLLVLKYEFGNGGLEGWYTLNRTCWY